MAFNKYMRLYCENSQNHAPLVNVIQYFVLYCIDIVLYYIREGRGTMVTARKFVNVADCRAVSNPAW